MKAFFDIDTQLDFVAPGGALYGAGAEKLVPAVAALNRFAQERSIPLISSTDAHPENSAEFKVWPPHCVAGTFGQQKAAATLLTSRTVIPYDSGFDVGAVDRKTPQMIVEKDNLDVFTNPHFPALLDRLGVTECFVYGIFIDYCVKYALMGLVRSGRRVSLITDAAASISAEAGEVAIRDFVAVGGFLATSVQVAELFNRET